MTDVRVLGFICAALALAAMFELIRRQNLKEKYSILWLLVAVVIVALAVYPHLLDMVADLTGIQAGPNVLVLFGGLAVTMVCVHLSVEVSKAEDRTRALAEEIGLLRLELDKVSGRNHQAE